MDDTVIVNATSQRMAMRGQCVSFGAANSRSRNEIPLMLLSTTIKEEDEEDLVELSSPRRSPSAVLHPDATSSRILDADEGRHGVTLDRNAARSAVSSVVAATSKLLRRLLRSGRRRRNHSAHSPCRDATAASSPMLKAHRSATASLIPSAAPATATPLTTQLAPRVVSRPPPWAAELKPALRPDATIRPRPDSRPMPQPLSHQQQHHHQQHAQRHLRQQEQQRHLRQQEQQQQPQQHPQHQRHHLRQRPPQQSRAGHLVQLMDGDDVRLALQALQLAAQIHDHMWGTAGPTAADRPDEDDDPRRRREVRLEAAEPLYDTAMAAARAIQHRALHSLVKQAVRRYVNPGRGSPDDVLQVILELLTGCGGAVEAAAAQPPPSAGRAAAAASLSASAAASTSRCFREGAAGGRPGRSAAAAAAAATAACAGRAWRGPDVQRPTADGSVESSGSSCGSAGGGSISAGGGRLSSSGVSSSNSSSSLGAGSGGGSNAGSWSGSLSIPGWDSFKSGSSSSGGDGGGGVGCAGGHHA
ncbi:hypothetical protein PLESTF_001592300 [Pleodorina starrii]|nr:hypothetical protein PLESTF_001592300 [Pleodorina starrii]